MQKRSLQQQMYELRGPATAQRVVLIVLLGAGVAIAWWLLVDGGIAVAGTWFGQSWDEGVALRRVLLATAFSIYFLRLIFTEFVFLKRGMSWAEALTIAPWVLCIFVFLSFCGERNNAPFDAAGAGGIFLFVLGSWMNTYAEYARHIWKQRPENRGKLYTLGLFRFCQHPNYLGDLISFSGLCLLAGWWVTGIIPVLMLMGFVFVNVPALDGHLHDHYGSAFEAYAARTRKLIPFVY